MREADWKECVENGSARRVTPDTGRAESLAETAKARLDAITEINEKNCNFVFEDYYTSLLEIVQAKAFRKGYNVLNHVCLGHFLRDVAGRKDLSDIFDDLRFKRNSLTYYGRMMDYETAKDAIEKCRRLIKEIERVLK